MATLRDFGVPTRTSGGSQDVADVADAAGMGNGMRSFTSARFGTEADYLAAQEASARASGDVETANGLRGQIGALQQRAAAYAPDVSRIQDIKDISDVPGYVAGQVGGGVAGMMDPVGAATGIGAVGKAIGLIPHPVAKAISGAAQILGPAAAFEIGRRQSKGAFVNEAAANPAIAAGKTPEEINDEANRQSIAGGLLNTAAPSLVAGRVLGSGIAKGIAKLPALPRIGADIAGQTGLMTAQRAYSLHGLTNLDPNRDTSGDTMDLANTAAGAAIGIAPISGVSHAADNAFRRIGAQGDIRAQEPGEGKSGSKLIDTLAEGSKGGSKEEAASNWASALAGNPPVGNTDYKAAAIRGHDMLVGELSALAPTDPVAKDFLAKIQAIDPNTPNAIAHPDMIAAANHVIDTAGQKSEEANIIAAYQRAEKSGRKLSTEMEPVEPGDLGAAKGEKAAGVTGLKKGNHPDVVAADEAARVLAQRQKLTADVMDQGLTRPGPMRETAMSSESGQTHGPNGFVMEPTRVPANPILHKVARELGTEIAGMGSPGVAAKPTPGELARTQRIGRAFVTLYRDAAPRMLAEVARTAGIEGTKLHKALVESVKTAAMEPIHRLQARAMQRSEAAKQLVKVIPPQVERSLRAKGFDLTTEGGRETLLRVMEDHFDGHGEHGTLAMNNAFGKETMAKMEEVIGRRIKPRAGDIKLEGKAVKDKGEPTNEDQGSTREVSDDAEQEGATNFEKQAAEKGDTKVEPTRQFLFHGEQHLRTEDNSQKPFDRNKKKGSTEFGKLPTLVTADRLDNDGKNSLQKLHEKAFKMLGIDTTVPPYAESKNPNLRVEVTNAHNVMKTLGMSDDQIIGKMHEYRADEGEAPSSNLGSTIAQRAELKKKAADYFGSRFLITADSVTNNDHLNMPMSKLQEMTRRGAAKINWARLAKAGQGAAEDAAQLVRFTAADGKPRAVPASDLVQWARQGDQAHTASDSFDKAVKRNPAVEFRNHLASGIAALVHMGYAKDMPYMLSADGAKESFKDGLPPSLRVAGKTQGEHDEARAARVKADAETRVKAERKDLEADAIAEGSREYMGGEKSEAEKAVDTKPKVSADQARGEHEREFETPEELLHPGKEAPRERIDISGEQDSGQRSLPGVPKEEKLSSDRQWENPKAEHYDEMLQRNAADQGLKGQRERLPRAPISPEVADNRSPEARVPSEAEKPTKAGAVPIDRTDVQGRTSKLNVGKDVVKALTGSMSNALHVGAELMRDFRADPKAGLERAERYMASAARSDRKDASGLVGGKFYVAPVAEMVSSKNIAATKFGPDRDALVALRTRVAQVLLAAKNTEISGADKLRLTKGMIAAVGEDDKPVTLLAKDVNAKLKELATPAKPLEVKTEPPGKPIEQVRSEWAAKNVGGDFKKTIEGFNPDRLERLHETLSGEPPKGVDVKAWEAAREHVEDRIYDEMPGDRKLSTETDDPIKPGETHPFDDPTATKNRAETAAKVASGAPTSDEAKAKATAWVAKTLGPAVKVVFEKVMGGTAEWLHADQLIRIGAKQGPAILNRAYHEGMHALFSNVLANHPEAREAVLRAVSEPDMVARMTAILKEHGQGKSVKQLGTPEERAAFAFQFWKAGLLDMDKPATTVFQKITRVLRRVFGMVRDSEHALAIFDHFDKGDLAEPSAAGHVLAAEMKKGQGLASFRKKYDGFFQGLHAATSPAMNVLGRMESAAARELGKMFFTNPGDSADGKRAPGVLNRTLQTRNQYQSILFDAINGMSDRDLKDVANHLNLKTDLANIHYEPVQKAVKAVRALTDRYYKYATESVDNGGPGMRLNFLGKDHYPRVWDRAALIGDRQGFVKMLTDNYGKVLDDIISKSNPKGDAAGITTREDAANRLHDSLIERGGVEDLPEAVRDDGVLSPFFASQKERNFLWLKDEHAAPFLSKDLVGSMTMYINQGVRAAEYTRAFGQDGYKLSQMLDPQLVREKNAKGEWIDKMVPGKIEQELTESAKAAKVPEAEQAAWVARRMEDVRNAAGAMEGTLGKDISDTMRKVSSYMLAYQSLRLLPMGLFSMAMDPLGIKMSGGTTQDAWDAFGRGMHDVYTNWKANLSGLPKARQLDKWESLAGIVGSVSSHMFLEQMGEAHTSEFVADGARKMMRFLFNANGMTAWDRAMRVGATKAAVGFLETHAKNEDPRNSARWLEQLGLTADEVPLDKDGHLITDRNRLAKEKDISLGEATHQMQKVHYALARWTERAVLSPNAALRPAWGSDPHYQVLFHLKSFSYAFQHVQMKYAAQEAEAGNNAPALALAAAVPVMMASDLMKALMLGGGSLPAWQQGMSIGDRVVNGINRAGLTGVIGNMPLHDPTQVFGPAVSQVLDFAKTAVTDPSGLGGLVHGAIPGANLIHASGMANVLGAD